LTKAKNSDMLHAAYQSGHRRNAATADQRTVIRKILTNPQRQKPRLTMLGQGRTQKSPPDNPVGYAEGFVCRYTSNRSDFVGALKPDES
jgi:hypothetical protein